MRMGITSASPGRGVSHVSSSPWRWFAAHSGGPAPGPPPFRSPGLGIVPGLAMRHRRATARALTAAGFTPATTQEYLLGNLTAPQGSDTS